MQGILSKYLWAPILFVLAMAGLDCGPSTPRDKALVIHGKKLGTTTPFLNLSLKPPDVAQNRVQMGKTEGPIAIGLNFDGIPSTGVPDTNAAVGDAQVMESINFRVQVFDKASGAPLTQPVNPSQLFAGMGPPCETTASDGVIRHAHRAGRWIFTKVNGGSDPNRYLNVCLAISDGEDAAGAYTGFEFDMTQAIPDAWQGNILPDFPKIDVMNEDHVLGYTSNRIAQHNVPLCGFDLQSIFSGDPDPTALCFLVDSSGGNNNYLPVGVEGLDPPTGAPGLFVNIGVAEQFLRLVRIYFDFSNPSSSSRETIFIPVAPFTPPPSDAATQPAPGDLLSTPSRIQFPATVRNFADHSSLVAVHNVSTGGVTGSRWYVLRDVYGTPSVYQSGTVASDSTHHFLPSIIMDKDENIALGYSVSNETVFPGLRVVGRCANDPLGVFQMEQSLIEGTGAKTGGNRWGDYTSMGTDPDGSTLWFSSQYMAITGSRPNTRIASFQLNNCGPRQ